MVRREGYGARFSRVSTCSGDEVYRARFWRIQLQRDQDMLEDVVHEKQVGFRMRKELGMAMKTFVVPMVVGFLLAKQSFGGSSSE